MKPPVLSRYLLLASAYFLSGWLGLQVPYIGAHITLIWLPTGIAVAALLRWGGNLWPGVFTGAFLVNVAISGNPLLAAGIAIGNTLAPLLTARWLSRTDFHVEFDRQKDVVNFLAAATVGMLLSATGGILSLMAVGVVTGENFLFAWSAWWMGDTVGVLLAAPFCLTVNRTNLEKLVLARKELLIWSLVAIPVVWLAFVQDYPHLGKTLPLAFMTLPLVAWSALRFGHTGATLASFVFSVVGAWCTATGHGTFHLPDAGISLLLLWLYMATAVLSGLLILALLAERQQVENNLRISQDKLNRLFELSPLGIALTDMQGHYLEFNEAFRQICDYPTEQLKALDYWELTPKEYAADEQHQLETLVRSGRYGPYEKEYIRRDGSRIPLRLNGVLMTDREGRRFIWSIIEDISERRRQDRQLQAALEAAEAANLAKSRFLATMSHEIRTPMNGILGMAQLLLLPALSDEERQEYARTVLGSGQTLLALLNDILDLSKVEAGRLDLTDNPFVPSELLGEVLHLFAEPAKAKGLRLESRWVGTVADGYVADALRIRQMLSNLVSNAVKFTAQGQVMVEAREVERNGQDVLLEFAVQDTGIGIARERQHILFKPFSQADASTTRQFGGTGLGLSIVLSLARLMGGDAGVISAEGAGSRFWFRVRARLLDGADILPGAGSDIGALLASQGEAGRETKARVLVAEDNAVNRVVVEAILGKMAHQVECVDNGKAAVEAVMNGSQPDLILMDVQMPEMDGLQATREIRQWEKATGRPPVPIIAVTAGTFDADRQQCLAAGMDDFLSKPVSLSALLPVLSKWLVARRP